MRRIARCSTRPTTFSATARESAGPPGCKASACATTSSAPTWCRNCSAPPPVAGYRYFLLGGEQPMIDRAAAAAAAAFPGWTQAGFHHGYLPRPPVDRRRHPPDQPRPARPAAGRHGQSAPGAVDPPASPRLEVPLCLGVGGLFHYWAGDLRRAPRWLRRLGPNGWASSSSSRTRPAAICWAIRCSSGDSSAPRQRAGRH